MTYKELREGVASGIFDTRCDNRCGRCEGCDIYISLCNYLNNNPEGVEADDKDIVPKRVLEYYELIHFI